jgi:hypothetical protein
MRGVEAIEHPFVAPEEQKAIGGASSVGVVQ